MQTLQKRAKHRRSHRMAVVIAAAIAAAASFSPAPVATADFADNLRDAVTQARQGSPCGALRPEPLADQTAAIAVRSTGNYLDHNARVIPVSDPLPILKDLGLDAGRAKLLQGAGQTEADAIKAILITGYKELPDCSYTQYGTSTSPNSNLGGWYLSTVVLAGP
ncbi:hypothetical protein [Mycobacterium colombiense]